MEHYRNNSEIWLLQIANTIILNSNYILKPGLLEGKLGAGIFLSRYGTIHNKETFCEFSDKLIEEAFISITNLQNLDISNGSSGIGWGIEYLIHEGFVEGDGDEILFEIDREIGSHIQAYIDKGLPVLQLIDYGIYFGKRIENNSLEDVFLFKKQHLFQLLLLLEQYLFQISNRKNTSHVNLTVFNYLLAIILKCYSLGYFGIDFKELLNKLFAIHSDMLNNNKSYLKELLITKKLINKYKEILAYEFSFDRHWLLNDLLMMDIKIEWDDLLLLNKYFIDLFLLDLKIEINKCDIIKCLTKNNTWDDYINNINDTKLSLGNGISGIGMFLI